MTKRATYWMSSEAKSDHAFKFLTTQGRNPKRGTPPESTSIRPRWPVQYDAPEQLPKDHYQPELSACHWERGEYYRNYGNNTTRAPDFKRCCAPVSNRDGWGSSQCGNKIKADPDHTGAFTRCNIHSRAKQAAKADKRRIESEARNRAWAQRSALRDAHVAALALIKAIAKGHNDPRTAAVGLLAKYEIDQTEAD